jgi:hypothetical protein
VIGFASGVLLSLATGAMAASPTVQAILFPSTINIHKGESTVTLGSNYEVLNYNNSVYIPIRAFSENMGSAVTYTGPKEGTLPQIDVYSTSQPWRSTYLGAGNQDGFPLFVRLTPTPESDSVGFHTRVYSTSKELVSLKSFKLKIEITKVGEQQQLVWSTVASYSAPDESMTDVIPGADSEYYWGLISPIIYWDKKDSSGKPVGTGQYKIQIKPVTIEYVTMGQQISKTQKIEPDMYTTFVVDIP